MHEDGLSDREIIDILDQIKTIAIVGASPKPDRPSYEVLSYLQENGFQIILINPGHAGQNIAGLPVKASLEEALPLDTVDFFRSPEKVLPEVEQAIRLGAKIIWMQKGVINREAFQKAKEAGLKVVMDRCPLEEITRLGKHRLKRFAG